ncbi:hypothetical protein AJ80_05774 [Polytolypa hystricis UAMH7299]|uniref:Prenylated Rab acceptor 1 n=1 Tax=Polytolypa hystricis (strain UAMH7299) TaxID=1447883 RepID=A0A2B7Y213_POLH7|nr:hypothetical protein AJ80_05774 [Polytolypa hystricis UAMH7299]
MPQWGRPPGARAGRTKKGLVKQLEDVVKMQELESEDDDDDDQGVLLLPERVGMGAMRYSDTDYNSRARRKATYDYDDESDYSADDDYDEHGLVDDGDPNNTIGYAMQLAMKDKEGQLVEKALERIRRAQMLGKGKVKLSQRELDALEKKRLQNANSRGPQRIKSVSTWPSMDNPKEKMKDRKLLAASSSEAYTSSSQPLENSLAYYSSVASRPSSSSSQARPRTPSMQSFRMPLPNTPPRVQYQQQMYQSPLPYSVPEAAPAVRPASSSRIQPFPLVLPDDPQYAPRPHSNSNITPYPTHQVPYQPYPATQFTPFDSRYVYGSAPSETPYYQAVYRSASGDTYPRTTNNNNNTTPGSYPSSPRPSPRKPRAGSGSSSSDGGVQIVKVTEKKPSGTQGNETSTTTNVGGSTSRSSRQRRGPR